MKETPSIPVSLGETPQNPGKKGGDRIITLKNNAVVANSRDVAAYFDKRHDNVLRDIEALIEVAPEAALNFEECPYQSVEGGRTYRSFDMTRTGFTLLAIGFTGAKALSFKLKYIDQFDAMEAQLKKQAATQITVPTNLRDALLLAADELKTGDQWSYGT